MEQNMEGIDFFYRLLEIVVLIILGVGLWITGLMNVIGTPTIWWFVLFNISAIIWLGYIIYNKLWK